jgi:hypothetical protein
LLQVAVNFVQLLVQLISPIDTGHVQQELAAVVDYLVATHTTKSFKARKVARFTPKKPSKTDLTPLRFVSPGATPARPTTTMFFDPVSGLEERPKTRERSVSDAALSARLINIGAPAAASSPILPRRQPHLSPPLSPLSLSSRPAESTPALDFLVETAPRFQRSQSDDEAPPFVLEGLSPIPSRSPPRISVEGEFAVTASNVDATAASAAKRRGA